MTSSGMLRKTETNQVANLTSGGTGLTRNDTMITPTIKAIPKLTNASLSVTQVASISGCWYWSKNCDQLTSLVPLSVHQIGPARGGAG